MVYYTTMNPKQNAESQNIGKTDIGYYHSESIEDMSARTGRLYFEMDQFLNQPSDFNDPDAGPMYESFEDMAFDFGLNPENKWDHVVMMQDGVLFTGTKQKNGNWKNTRFVEWEDVKSHSNWMNIMEQTDPSGEPDYEEMNPEELRYKDYIPNDLDKNSWLKLADFGPEQNSAYWRHYSASDKTGPDKHRDAFQGVLDDYESGVFGSREADNPQFDDPMPEEEDYEYDAMSVYGGTARK